MSYLQDLIRLLQGTKANDTTDRILDEVLWKQNYLAHDRSSISNDSFQYLFVPQSISLLRAT